MAESSAEVSWSAGLPSVRGQQVHSFCLLPDEVGAIVVDMGSHTTRVGYAGEDMPKVRSSSLGSALIVVK